MTELDNPLKMLIATFDDAFATWLLGRRPERVRPLNVELPASTTRSDLVFEVLQSDGTTVILHIELQGRGSHDPMPWRMLGYMSRLARRELGDRPLTDSDRLHSVVIYTGEGTGANDGGHYEIAGPTGAPTLAWRYEPLLLWQMDAEELLALDEPAFLSLIGQTRLRKPEVVIPKAVDRIQQVENEEQRDRLLTTLISLMSNEEAIEMVEEILDSFDEYLLELPYQQRILQMGKEMGLAEGLSRGQEQGLTEGLTKGKEQGWLAGVRDAILETIALRFNPPAQEYRRISRQLEDVNDRDALHRLFVIALETEDMAAFVSHLEKELAQPSAQ